MRPTRPPLLISIWSEGRKSGLRKSGHRFFATCPLLTFWNRSRSCFWIDSIQKQRDLCDLVDGEHFFDIIADDVVYEVLYDVPGWPRVIEGRADLMAAFRGYCDNVALQAADKLIVHETDGGSVVVIEYEVHGTILATRVKYDNRFCSIIKIDKRKIAHWRDYMDSLAAWNALTAKVR